MAFRLYWAGTPAHEQDLANFRLSTDNKSTSRMTRDGNRIQRRENWELHDIYMLGRHEIRQGPQLEGLAP